jgi:signal transduction histidine kinase
VNGVKARFRQVLPRLIGPCVAVATSVATLHVVHDAPAFSFILAVPHGMVLLFLAGSSLALASTLHGLLRPGVQLELLLSVAVCAWLVAEWDNPAAPALAFSTGLAFAAATPAVIAHLALAYPSGKLRGRLDRAVVAIGYVSLIGTVGLAPSLFYTPETQGCFGCAHNMWGRWDDPRLFATLGRAGVRLGLVWLIAALALIAWRLTFGSPARRRAVASVVVPCLCYLVTVIAEYGHSLGRGYLGVDVSDARLWRLQALALAGVGAGVIAALVRGRIAHRSLTRIVLDLRRTADSLRESLAVRLGDATLDLAYPLGDGRYADRDGKPIDVGKHSAATPLLDRGTELALILHRPGRLDNPELIGDTVEATRLALENERLRARSLAQLAELQASGVRIVSAADRERRRLERDLHDGAQQHLVGLLMALRLARASATPDDGRLAIAQAQLERTITALRELAHGLYPVLLEDAGLGPALTALSETRRLRVTATPDQRMPHVVETTAYRLVEQCSRAGATTVKAAVERAWLNVDLEVDGEPADLEEVADRVATLSGSLQLEVRDGAWHARLALPISTGSRKADLGVIDQS